VPAIGEFLFLTADQRREKAPMLRLARFLVAITLGGMLGCAPVHPPATIRPQDRAADRRELVHLVDDWVSKADRAWEKRDARLMFEGPPEMGIDTSAIIKSPDGRSISREANIADLQRRMDMTTRIDTMRTVVDSIFFTPGDTAVVYSSQRFVRMMKLPGQPERRRISSVVHRQRFHLAAGKWAAAGPIEELQPQARWAD
jgi:hypothetical protein